MDEMDRVCFLIRRGVEDYVRATLEAIAEGLRETFRSTKDLFEAIAAAFLYRQYEQVVRNGIQALEEGRLGTGEGQDD